MALIDTLKHVKIHELTDKERNDLRKTLQEWKRECQVAIRGLDRNLKALKKKPKPKKAAKRRATRAT